MEIGWQIWRVADKIRRSRYFEIKYLGTYSINLIQNWETQRRAGLLKL
jgi:hypothetical protein